MIPIRKWYKCTKCEEKLLDEDEVDEKYGVFSSTDGQITDFVKVKIHKGKCKGRVEETELFERKY